SWPVPMVHPEISKTMPIAFQCPGLNFLMIARSVWICAVVSPVGPIVVPGPTFHEPSMMGPGPVTGCVPSGKNTQNFDHQNACGKTSFGQYRGGRVGHPKDKAE